MCVSQSLDQATSAQELFSREDLRQNTASGARVALIEAAEAAIVADPAAASAAGVDKVISSPIVLMSHVPIDPCDSRRSSGRLRFTAL